MRRSHIAMVTVLAATLGACATPQAARSSAYAGRGAVAPSPVRLTSAPARSSRSSAAVSNFVRARYTQLQFCHDDARVRGTAPTGNARIEVTLAEDGYVLRARVTERAWNGDGREVEECMLTTVRRWVFPKSGTMDEYVHTFAVSFGDAKAARFASRP
jgi:hypothetical protein